MKKFLSLVLHSSPRQGRRNEGNHVLYYQFTRNMRERGTWLNTGGYNQQNPNGEKQNPQFINKKIAGGGRGERDRERQREAFIYFPLGPQLIWHHILKRPPFLHNTAKAPSSNIKLYYICGSVLAFLFCSTDLFHNPLTCTTLH